MIGYEVTVTAAGGYRRIYEGWFEGSPVMERKVKEAAAKQALKYLLKQIAGGGPVKVADIISKPFQGLAKGIGEFIAAKLKEINRLLANEGLSLIDVEVTLTGDFRGSYLIEDSDDLDKLPALLALIPQKGTTDEFMGENVLESVYMAHVNFARHIRNMGDWDVSNPRDVRWLRINIDL